jgi:ribosomal protein L11 methyltransferase
VSAVVSAESSEEARARMLALFPEGFEENETGAGLELSAYTDAEGEARLRRCFEAVRSVPVDADWAERWREFHRPITVGPFWVGPPWAEPPTGRLAVVIDPGQAFGTGAHPTTRLCLELLAVVDPGSLLDIGCGSGVLAIAGASRGLAPVFALDADPAAVTASRDNAARNGVAVEVRLADALVDPLPEADVAVANVTLEVVAAVATRLTASCFIASGYLESDESAVHGFERRERLTAEGWAADLFERAS